MKRRFAKFMITSAALALVCACGDDSSSSPNTPPSANAECAGIVATADAYVLNANGVFVIYADGNVTDAAGNPVGYFADGILMDLNGTPITTGIDLNALSGLYPLMDEYAQYFHHADNDRLHPNDEGHRRMAQVLMYQLLSIPLF